MSDQSRTPGTAHQVTRVGPPGASAGPGVLTFRQWLWIGLCVLAAVAFQFNRPQLPAWARAETWPLWQSVGAGDSQLAKFVFGVKRFEGHRTLVIGDSMAMDWPWPADLLVLPGTAPQQLAAAVRQDLPGTTHRYRQVVIWSGTAFVMGGPNVAQMLRQYGQLVEAARPYGGRLVLLSPMPAKAADVRAFLQRVEGGEHRAESIEERVAQIPALVSGLRSQFPELVVCDLTPFQQALEASGALPTLLADGVHLTREGFTMLRPWLEQCGVALAESDVEMLSEAGAPQQAVPPGARVPQEFRKEVHP